MNKLLWLIPALLATDAVAAPIPIDAHEAFQLQRADGGLTGDTYLSFVLPLPGQDRALVYASELGLAPPDSIVTYSVVQLGGPDAGAVVQRTLATPFLGLPTFAFRVQESSGATNVWLRSDADELGRLEADRVSDDPNLDGGPNIGAEWLTLSPDGHLRFTGGSSTGIGLLGVEDLDAGFVEVLVASRDGGLAYALTPPGTDRFYATAASTPPLELYTGSWSNGGPLVPVGTVPNLFDPRTSAAFYVGETVSFVSPSTTVPGALDVTELLPTGAVAKGSFVVRVDGGVCDNIACGLFLNPRAIQEGFPGYPQGALLVANYRTLPVVGPDTFQVVLVDWGDVAAAFGLTIDAGPLPAAHFGGIPDAGSSTGGGPDGGGGPVGPGPGTPASQGGSCASAPGGTGPGLLLVALGLVALRRARRSSAR